MTTSFTASASTDQPSTPVSTSVIERVRSAVQALLAATQIDLHTVAQELDQARKREVGEYLGVLAAGLNQLNALIGAGADQVEQFTGDTNTVAEVEESLSGAYAALTDLADDLHPSTTSAVSGTFGHSR